MNQKKEKYMTRRKTKYYESSLSSEEEEVQSVNERKGGVKSKKKVRQRQENSLGELTKNFIHYIKQQGGKDININDVVEELKVKKRRIYDITNVLEGIGYIKKLEKNKIRWLRDDLYNSDSDEENDDENNWGENQLEKEVNDIMIEDSKLDTWIHTVKSSFEKVTDSHAFKEFGYVTYNDLKTIALDEDVTVLTIKAPAGTSLEIPNPDNVESTYLKTLENMQAGLDDFDKNLLDSLENKYQIFLDSQSGEIKVFVITNKIEDNRSEISARFGQSLMPNNNQFSNTSKNSPINFGKIGNNILQPTKFKNNVKFYSDNEMMN